MKSFKETALWLLLFLVFMGVGYFHGQLPSEVNRKTLLHSVKIEVITTDDLLFPPGLQQSIESEMNVQFEVNVTHDWNELLAKLIANPSPDLIFVPSYWAHSLAQQDLLSNQPGKHADLLAKFSPDFLKPETDGNFVFLPLYWLKTDLFSEGTTSFAESLKDKKRAELFLLGDEDLLLAHLEQWKNEDRLDLIKAKKLLTLSLKDLSEKTANDSSLIEIPLTEANSASILNGSKTSALLSWGVAIPKNSAQKDLALKALMLLTNTDLQEKSLDNSPFISALQEVGEKTLPLQKRAEFIRSLNLTNTIFIEKKDPEARKKLQTEYNITL